MDEVKRILKTIYNEMTAKEKKRLKIIAVLDVLWIIFVITMSMWHKDIPYANWITCFTFWGSIFFVGSITKTVSFQAKSIIFTVSFVIAVLSWVILSYQSYYNGAKTGVMRDAHTVQQAIELILASGIPEPEKQRTIKDFILKKSKDRSEISIYKNDELLVQKSVEEKDRSNYIIENILDHDKPFKKIESNGNVYQMEYNFYNRPYLYTGVTRSFLFSTLTDPISNEKYVTKHNYERSLDFSIVFSFLFIPLLIIASNVNKKNELNDKLEKQKTELERKNYDIQKANNELKNKNAEIEQANLDLYNANSNLHIFEQTFKKIQSDYESITRNRANDLQCAVSTWDSIKKKSSQLSRHDAIGRIKTLRDTPISPNTASNDPEQQKRVKAMIDLFDAIGREEKMDITSLVYDFMLLPWVETIRTELQGLDKTLNITPSLYTTKEIIENIVPGVAIPVHLANGKMDGIDFKVEQNLSGNVMDKKCNIILDKLMSVILNLIGNSVKAIQEFNDQQYYDGKEEREGHVVLKLLESSKNGGSLCIEVLDNGGGFPKNIKDSIYKERIKTTQKNDSRIYGEGTAYVGYFVKLMKGSIIAENISYESGEIGASTKIFIPYEKA